MKYFAIILFILISCGKSTEKQTLENFDLEKLDVFNNEDINIFIQSFLLNQEPNQREQLPSDINLTKYIGNNLTKDSFILNGKNLRMVSQKELDSLISKEDWKFIRKQINDNRDYLIDKKFFKQKVLDSDSLKIENEKYTKNTVKITDSLKKINMAAAKEYVKQSDLEYLKFTKKFTPILHIDKPLFTKDKKLVIFSYSTYSGPLSAFSETAIYEFRDKKWRKIKSVRMMIS